MTPDSGSTIKSVNVGGNLPAGLNVRIISNDTGHWAEVSWDGAVLRALPDNADLDFFIVVTSANGATSVLEPSIEICECLNNGKCGKTAVSLTKGGVLRFAPCTCTAAYSGSHCEKDKDGCESAFQPCFSGVACNDVIAPGVGFTCGKCPSGFSGDGINCFGRWWKTFFLRLFFCNGAFLLQWGFSFAMGLFFCNGAFLLQWGFSFAMGPVSISSWCPEFNGRQ